MNCRPGIFFVVKSVDCNRKQAIYHCEYQILMSDSVVLADLEY